MASEQVAKLTLCPAGLATRAWNDCHYWRVGLALWRRWCPRRFGGYYHHHNTRRVNGGFRGVLGDGGGGACTKPSRSRLASLARRFHVVTTAESQTIGCGYQYRLIVLSRIYVHFICCYHQIIFFKYLKLI